MRVSRLWNLDTRLSTTQQLLFDEPGTSSLTASGLRADEALEMREHPIDRWFRGHHLHLRVALAVSAIGLVAGLALGLGVLTAVAGLATSVTATLVMLYLPRS
jgi:hypothetical protein